MSTPSGPVSGLPPLPILFVNGSRQLVYTPCQTPLSIVAIGQPGDGCVIRDSNAHADLASGKFAPDGIFEAFVPPPPPCPNIFALEAVDTSNGKTSNVVVVFAYLMGSPQI